MAKQLLILALVAMQSASWSGASLFLCLAADGSICIDGGPQTCACCHDEDVTDECGPSPDVCCHDTDRDRDANGAEGGVIGDPCDCLHVQISLSAGPSLIARSASKSAWQRVALVTGLPEYLWRNSERPKPVISRATADPPRGTSLAMLALAVAVRTC